MIISRGWAKWALGGLFALLVIKLSAAEVEPPLDARFMQALALLEDKLAAADSPRLEIKSINNEIGIYQPLDDGEDDKIAVIQTPDFYNLHSALRQVVSHFLGEDERQLSQVINSDFSSENLQIPQLVQQIKTAQPLALTDNKALKDIVDALAIFSFFMDDQVDKMQLVKANAWASLALWEVKKQTRDDVLEMMVAQGLGYEVYAKHVAAKLTDNAVHAYYFDDIGEIAPSPFLNLVLVKRSAYNHDAEKWQDNVSQLAQTDVSPSLIFANVNTVDSFDVRSKLLLLYPLILSTDFLENDKTKSTLFKDGKLALNIENITAISNFFLAEVPYKPSQLLSQFESEVKATMPLDDGLLNEGVLVDFWQAQMFNAYYNIGVYLTQVERGSSLANNLQLVLQANTHSDNGRILYAWFESMNAENSYNATMNQLIKLASDDNVPVLLLKSLQDWMYELRPSLTKEYLSTEPFVSERLDSRYTHRLIDLQLQARHDPVAVAAQIDLTSYRYSVDSQLLEVLDTIGDLALLHTAYDKAIQPEDQARIIQLIFKHGGGSTPELANLEALYQNSENTFSLLEYYVDVLLEYTTEYETAMTTMDAWITQRRDLSKQDYLDLIALIAKARLKAGQTDKAWQAISPTLSFNYPGTMLVAADILLAQKKVEQTNQMIANYRRHYPNTLQSLSYQLKSLWLQGKPEVAADLVTYWYYPLSDEQFLDYVVTPIKSISGDDVLKNRFIDALKQSGLSENRLALLIAPQ